MSSSRDKKTYTVFSAQGSATTAGGFYAGDFRNANLTLFFDNSANMTVKLQGAIGETCPDFSSAAAADNQWDYIQCVDYEDGNQIDGDTGLVITSDENRIVEFNTNQLDWVAVTITTYSAGDVTATLTLTTNE